MHVGQVSGMQMSDCILDWAQGLGANLQVLPWIWQGAALQAAPCLWRWLLVAGMFLKSDQAQEKVPFCSRAEAADLIAGLGAEILSSWGLSGNNFHNWERKEVMITRKRQMLYRLVLFRHRLPRVLHQGLWAGSLGKAPLACARPLAWSVLLWERSWLLAKQALSFVRGVSLAPFLHVIHTTQCLKTKEADSEPCAYSKRCSYTNRNLPDFHRADSQV